MEYTAGPWRKSGKYRVYAADGQSICTTNAEADTALIAAAPELLAALKDARFQLEQYEMDATGEHYNNRMINAIIAKAEDAPVTSHQREVKVKP